jgi:pterin-4a-carbinolamine dehydratase/uncharacterized protein (DUF2267 family)
VSHVVQYDELLDAVSARAGLAESDDAKAAVKAVLAGLAHWIDVPERQAVADILPLELRYVMESPRPTVGGDLPRFLQFVAFVVDTTPEGAQRDTRAILSVLRDGAPDIAERLRKVLPQEFAPLFTPPAGDETAPDAEDRTAEPAPAAEPAAAAEAAPASEPTPAPEPAPRPDQAAAELTPDDVTAVLRRLPGWRGNTRRLTRTVALDPGRDAPILAEIHRIEDELDHHALLQQGAQDLTLTLWTHSRDVVTELDVQLAERIHAVLARL